MNVEKHQLHIGKRILTRREAEQEAEVFYPAFSRVVLEDAVGKRHVFWLVERVYGDLRVQRSAWSGIAVGGHVNKEALQEGEGTVVSKNARFGLLLDEYGEQLGRQIRLFRGLKRQWGAATATIINCTHYLPQGDDAINGSMHVGEDVHLNFLSLRTLISELEDLIGDGDSTSVLESEIGVIEALNRAQEQRLHAFREAKQARIRHVITSAALRNQPKLDAEQVRAKKRQILDGQVIIQGSPGTGKTTALLDRISLLTDHATIREHVPSLSDGALDRLTDPDTAYLLFTPNELLVHYLKETMNAKGLLADSSKLKTWAGYRDQLAQQMGLLQADRSKSPFIKDRVAFRMESQTFNVRADEWKTFLTVLRETFSEFVSRRHRRILDIEANASHAPTLVQKVQDYLDKAARARDPSELMRIFESLKSLNSERAGKPVTEADKEARNHLNRLATRLHARIRADTQVHHRLLTALAELRGDHSGEDDGDSETDIHEQHNVDQKTLDVRENDDIALIGRTARGILRKLALRRGLASVQFTGSEQIMLDHVRPWIDDHAIETLAPLLLISLLREPCAGPDSNVVNQVRFYYPWLRRTHFVGRLTPFLHPNQQSRLAESGAPKGKSIVSDELDLVLFLQLWLLRIGWRTRRSRKSSLSRTFEHSLREIIAVDEATDFSPIQLACMAMTANPAYDCITLAGDLMQRVTDVGLRKWEEYESVAGAIGLARVHRVGLRISYRQSRRLHSITTRLYEASTGNPPSTRSAYPPSEHDPFPLLHVGTDRHDCAEWIARRIVEIRRSYDDQGIIPTIAVLVPDESSVDTFADALEEARSLGGNIEVDRCHNGRILGESASVRIFNVKHIKGLEFEAAFFHDMGAIAARFSTLAEKLLYVGLSRASLYLGITVIGDTPQVLDPLADDLILDGDWST